MISQAAPKFIPGLGGIGRFGGARKDFDLHFRGNCEALMRAVVFEPCDRVAEGVHVLAGEAWLRIEDQRMFETALKCKFAGLQVQLVMRVHHVAAVLV